jgi:hypothetical protein
VVDRTQAILIKTSVDPWCEEGALDWNWSGETIDDDNDKNHEKQSAFNVKIGYPFALSTTRDTHIRAPHRAWMLLASVFSLSAWIHLRLEKQPPESGPSDRGTVVRTDSPTVIDSAVSLLAGITSLVSMLRKLKQRENPIAS